MKKIELKVLKSDFIIQVLISIIAGLSAYFWTVFFTSETSFLDMRMQTAAAINGVANKDRTYDRIVIVTVSENVLIRYNHPDITPRSYLAGLIDRLSAFRPKVIGMDYIFDQPSSDRSGDDALKSALKRAGNVVIGYPRVATIRGYNSGVTETLLGFFKYSRSSGFLNTVKDKAGVVRYYDFAIGNEASFAHEILACWLGLPPVRFQGDGSWFIPETNRDYFTKQFRVPASFYYRSMMVNYRDALENLFTVYDGDEVLSVPAESAAFFRENIKDKIVIIGDTGYGRDLHKTPFSPPDGGNNTYGVLIQANVLKNLLEREFVVETPPWLLALIVAAAVSYALFFSARFRFMTVVFAVFGFMALYTALSFLLYLAWNVWLPVVLVISMAFLTALAVVLVRVMFSESDNSKADVFLSKNIAPSVIQRHINSEPESIFAAKQADLVLLACYVKNIPQISEANKSQKINDFINYYYRMLKEVVFAFEGCFNRLPLNGALAFWNAPVKDPRAIEKAVMTAREIIYRLSLIDRKGRALFKNYRNISIDIALHSGPAMVGYFGPEGNQDYSVIGDTVDDSFSIAEGFSEDKESWILVSAEVKKEIKKEKLVKVNKKIRDKSIFRMIV